MALLVTVPLRSTDEPSMTVLVDPLELLLTIRPFWSSVVVFAVAAPVVLTAFASRVVLA